MKMKKKEEKEEASLKAKFKEAKEQTTISLKCNNGKEKNEEVNDQPATYTIELEDKEKLLSLIRGLSVEAIMSKIPLEEETPVKD